MRNTRVLFMMSVIDSIFDKYFEYGYERCYLYHKISRTRAGLGRPACTIIFQMEATNACTVAFGAISETMARKTVFLFILQSRVPRPLNAFRSF